MRVDLVSYRTASVVSAASSLLSEWRVGAVLQAIAVRDADGQLWLDIGDQRLPARIASGEQEGPQDGEQLQVRVLRNHPVLALETISSKTAETDASEQTVMADAMRRFMPRQESPAMMLANIAWLAQGKHAAQLPKEVVDAAAQLWRALPDANALRNPEKLEAALARSGTFLEGNLANASGNQPANIATDIKALMLELSRILRENGARPALARSDISAPAPLPTASGSLANLPNTAATFSLLDSPSQQMNELARQTDGAIARLTTVQLANNAAANNPAILLELPVRFEDRANILRLRIERDGRSSSQEAELQSWSIEAAMDLGLAGSLHARVSLQGHRVGVQIRASSPAVVDSLSAQSATLESMLRGAGLEVDRVVCLHGLPATDTGARPTRLVDVRA